VTSAWAHREHFVYRLFDREGLLLYVGMTRDVRKRMKSHERTKAWWCDVDTERTVVTSHPCHAEAADAELVEIETTSPLCNSATTRHVLASKPNMVMRSLRVSEKLWTEAKAKADEQEENVSDVLREALERYVRSKR
jgi:predicted GIY-YIG superfamily endonuclease